VAARVLTQVLMPGPCAGNKKWGSAVSPQRLGLKITWDTGACIGNANKSCTRTERVIIWCLPAKLKCLSGLYSFDSVMP
jgi:hypothetical protein